MIWDSRQTSRPRQPARKYVVVQRKDEAESGSGPDNAPQASSTAIGDTNLRHRTTAATADDTP